MIRNNSPVGSIFCYAIEKNKTRIFNRNKFSSNNGLPERQRNFIAITMLLPKCILDFAGISLSK